MSEDDGKYQCYLHMQTTWPQGSGQAGEHIIISGRGETSVEATGLFDHALDAYKREFRGDDEEKAASRG